MTISKLLATRGYGSALIGKFHIALPDMNPAGNAVVHDLGWNYFADWLDETGDPRERQFRASFAVDAAAEWVNSRPADRPWMATVSLSSIHTPLVQPPVDPTSSANVESSDLPLDALSDEQQAAYDELAGQLAAIRATVVACPGDGNIDGVVDAKDLQDWEHYAESWGLSSVYDLNLDGRTDTLDRDIILENLGLDCRDGGA